MALVYADTFQRTAATTHLQEPPPLSPPLQEQLLPRHREDKPLPTLVGRGAPPQPPLDPDARAAAITSACGGAIGLRSRRLLLPLVLVPPRLALPEQEGELPLAGLRCVLIHRLIACMD